MTSIPIKIVCPLGADCETVKDGAIHRCAWYVKVRGTNHNTNEEIDEWGCAMNWMPFLLIENSGMQRQTGAAVENFRNEMIKANETNQRVLLAVAQADQRLIEVQK